MKCLGCAQGGLEPNPSSVRASLRVKIRPKPSVDPMEYSTTNRRVRRTITVDAMSPSQWLERQHRVIDTGVLGAVDGSGSTPALADAVRLLREHIHCEEQVLFPPLEAIGLAMPVFVMKREHAQMWPLLEQLSADCSASADHDATQERAYHLYRLLQMHNTKEEQILYAAADRLAATQTPTLTLQALQDARTPEGWVCAMAT